jgi:hypothetical protein
MIRVLAVLAVPIALLLLGPRDAPAWSIHLDFEGGAAGEKAEGASAFGLAGSHTTFSADIAHTGRQSAKLVWTRDDSGFGKASGEYYFDYVPVERELWMRGYFYFAAPWSWKGACTRPEEGCDSIKTIRALLKNRHSGQVVGSTSVITNSGGVPYAHCETCKDQNIYQGAAVRLDPGRWYALELYIYLHPTKGKVRMWIDGELKASAANLSTARSDDDVLYFSYWMGYWNGRCGRNQAMYIDDVVLTDETPAGRDAFGNPMIGTSRARPAPPSR